MKAYRGRLDVVAITSRRAGISRDSLIIRIAFKSIRLGTNQAHSGLRVNPNSAVSCGLSAMTLYPGQSVISGSFIGLQWSAPCSGGGRSGASLVAAIVFRLFAGEGAERRCPQAAGHCPEARAPNSGRAYSGRPPRHINAVPMSGPPSASMGSLSFRRGSIIIIVIRLF